MKSIVNGVPVTTVLSKEPDLRTAMTEFDTALDEEAPAPDAETMLTPLNAVGHTPRALMARKLTDIVVLPAGRISGNERALVADILLQVLDKVDQNIRIEIADRVARVAECPPALVRMLLLDDPVVAERVLMSGHALPDALLIETARDGSMAHREMIAKRTDLAPSVADACLQYDEGEVCKLVLKRENCQISPNAINKLVALSALNSELQSFLLRRSELEPAHGFTMFWWVDTPEHRKRILLRFALDRRLIQDVLEDLYARAFRGNEADPFVQEILALAERRHRPRGVDGESISMGMVIRTLAASYDNPIEEIVDAVRMIGGISRELAARILRDGDGEPFAVLCKSLGMPRDDFYNIVDRPDAEGHPPDHGDYLLSIFDSIARDYSRAVLRYWDWDTNPRIAHITRLLALLEDEI